MYLVSLTKYWWLWSHSAVLPVRLASVCLCTVRPRRPEPEPSSDFLSGRAAVAASRGSLGSLDSLDSLGSWLRVIPAPWKHSSPCVRHARTPDHWPLTITTPRWGSRPRAPATRCTEDHGTAYQRPSGGKGSGPSTKVRKHIVYYTYYLYYYTVTKVYQQQSCLKKMKFKNVITNFILFTDWSIKSRRESVQSMSAKDLCPFLIEQNKQYGQYTDPLHWQYNVCYQIFIWIRILTHVHWNKPLTSD